MEKLIKIKICDLSNHQLSTLMVYLNDQYRIGSPKVSDAAFDYVYMPALFKRIPTHALITKVQVEPQQGTKGRIKHVHPMLSTKKAYLHSELNDFFNRCLTAANKINITQPITYKLSAKLDGLAATLDLDKQLLLTRGDGLDGSNISPLLNQGLIIEGDGSGVGEIVVSLSYFKKYLSDYKHPRNFVSGIANSISCNGNTDSLSTASLQALKDGAIKLVLFKDLFTVQAQANEILANPELMAECANKNCQYLCDGTVIEVVDDELKTSMGANDHNHHWQIAFKQKGDTANVRVTDVQWNVGRNQITPVINIEPTWLSGAMISKVTGHHAGRILSEKIGKGSLIEIIRSGEIIPTYLTSLETGSTVIPTHCPCCKKPVVWANDFITCTNIDCEDRTISSIVYHFEKIGVDLFGRKTVAKLVRNGIKELFQVYGSSVFDFTECGIGLGQARNLSDQLLNARNVPVDDFKVLASIGINTLGKGSSKRLLAVTTIDQIHELTSENIAEIDGFGDITSVSISAAFQKERALLHFLCSILNIRHTKSQTPKSGTLMGLRIVFTGKMESNRNEMKNIAEINGADVQSSVRKDTNYLVTGQSVGATKISAAQAKGVNVISEVEFYELIA